MGREATCTCRLDGEEAHGKALLETAEIVFRPLKLKIPLAEITKLEASDGELRVRFGRRLATFGLGEAEAAKWLKAIQNPKTLADKLGLKAGLDVAIVGVTDSAFLQDVSARVGAFASKATKGHDVVFVALETAEDLKKLAKLKAALKPDGALWTVREKGRKDLSEAMCRQAALAAGLVDVKVASFSATHTAEKYVIPVGARKRP